MAKALQLATIEEATKDPRQRMKEVRADVRMFVESDTNPWGLNHIGEMYTDPKDMRRAMIALHDMYDVRAQKHNKASNHVADLLAVQDVLANTVEEQNNTIVFLNHAGEQLRDMYDQAIKENQIFKEDLAIQDTKLQAALVTLQTVMGG